MLTLKDYAIRLVKEKQTTISELLKILNSNIPEEKDEVITRQIDNIQSDVDMLRVDEILG